MFNHEEFIKYLYETILPDSLTTLYYEISDELHKFDPDIAGLEESYCKWHTPLPYNEEEPYENWCDNMYERHGFSCRLHFIYGAYLYKNKVSLDKFMDEAPIPEEKLRKIPLYESIYQEAVSTTFRVMQSEDYNPAYMSRWVEYFENRLALYAKAYMWIGYITARDFSDKLHKLGELLER